MSGQMTSWTEISLTYFPNSVNIHTVNYSHDLILADEGIVLLKRKQNKYVITKQ